MLPLWNHFRKWLAGHLYYRTFIKGPLTIFCLIVVQLLFVLTALAQSRMVQFRHILWWTDAAGERHQQFQTEQLPVWPSLLASFGVLILLLFVLYFFLSSLEIEPGPVLVPLFLLLTLSVVYQNYVGEPYIESLGVFPAGQSPEWVPVALLRAPWSHLRSIVLGAVAFFAAIWLSKICSRLVLNDTEYLFLLGLCWLFCLFSMGGTFLRIGSTQLQPGEILKFLSIFLTGIGYQKITQNPFIRNLFLGTLAFEFLILLLIVQDYGNAAVLMLVLLAVISLTCKFWFTLAVTLFGGVVAAVGAYGIVRFRPDSNAAWRLKDTLVGLTRFYADANYHSNHDNRVALFAALKDGIWGSGVGLHSNYLLNNQYAYTDFLFDGVVSFFGVGMGLVLVLCLIKIIRVCCVRSDDTGQDYAFYFYANAMSVILAAQGIIHIGGNLNILPFTGIIYPFASRGGTAMVLSFAELGFALGGRIPDRKVQSIVDRINGKLESSRRITGPAADRLSDWFSDWSEKIRRHLPDAPAFIRAFRRIRLPRGMLRYDMLRLLPNAVCLLLALTTAIGLIRLYSYGGEALSSATVAERNELSTALDFSQGDQNPSKTDNGLLSHAELRTSDGKLLWDSGQTDRIDSAWYGLVGNTAVLRTMQESPEQASRENSYLLARYQDELMKVPYNPITGIQTKKQILELNIDSYIQEEMSRWMNERNMVSCVFAYQPSDGSILCMASSPGYQVGTDTSQAPKGAMTNANLSNFAPGSTMKLVMLYLLRLQGVDIGSLRFRCNGSYTLKADGNVVECTGIHGEIGTAEAIGHSCNCFFAQCAELLDFPTAAQALQEMGVLVNRTDGTTLLGRLPRKMSYVEFSPDWSATFSNTFQLIGQDSGCMSPIDMATLTGMLATAGQSALPRLLASDPISYTTLGTEHAAELSEVYSLWKAGFDQVYRQNGSWAPQLTAAKTGTVNKDVDNHRQRTLAFWIEEYGVAGFIVVDYYQDVTLQEISSHFIETLAAARSRNGVVS